MFGFCLFCFFFHFYILLFSVEAKTNLCFPLFIYKFCTLKVLCNLFRQNLKLNAASIDLIPFVKRVEVPFNVLYIASF